MWCGDLLTVHELGGMLKKLLHFLGRVSVDIKEEVVLLLETMYHGEELTFLTEVWNLDCLHLKALDVVAKEVFLTLSDFE